MSLHRGQRVLAHHYGLSVCTGDILAVRGASGSGKTTLLRAIAGLIPPDGGRLELDGREPGAYPWPEYRARVSYLGQQPAFIDGTVRDNLARPFAYRCRADAFAEEEAVERLESWSLSSEMLDQPAGQLSVGEQQRVALIRTLLTRPWFLLLDEPTSALDNKVSRRVLKQLQRDAEAGLYGVLIVSHDESLVESVQTNVIDFPGAQG